MRVFRCDSIEQYPNSKENEYKEMINVANQNFKMTILAAVDNQLRENNPPVTSVTLERLKTLGYTEKIAKEKIAAVLIEEIYDVMKNNEVYNEERYSRKLRALK